MFTAKKSSAPEIPTRTQELKSSMQDILKITDPFDKQVELEDFIEKNEHEPDATLWVQQAKKELASVEQQIAKHRKKSAEDDRRAENETQFRIEL